MKRTVVLLAALVTAFAALAFGASAAPKGASLVIHHQVKGCHAWSLNHGKFQVVQNIHLARGATLVITNGDVMPHQLIKTFGPAVHMQLLMPGMRHTGTLKAPYATGMMPHMNSVLRVTFSAKGVYKLTTKFGEDYYDVGETMGEDNVLRAIVTVS